MMPYLVTEDRSRWRIDTEGRVKSGMHDDVQCTVLMRCCSSTAGRERGQAAGRKFSNWSME